MTKLVASTMRTFKRHGFWRALSKGLTRSGHFAWELSLRLRRREFIYSRYGVELKANWGDRTFLMCVRGSYGSFLENVLRKNQNPFVFLDIGANQGVFTLIAAQNSDCLTAVALEPVKSTADLLCANAQRNGLSHRIQLLRAALSSDAGTSQIKIERGHSGLASFRNGFAGDGTTEEVTLVTMDVVDEYLPDHGAIYVKVDVEGHEDIVIEQLSRSRHKGRFAFVFYEVDEAWHDPEKLEQSLRQIGFTSFTKIGVGRHYDVAASRSDLPASQPHEVK